MKTSDTDEIKQCEVDICSIIWMTEKDYWSVRDIRSNCISGSNRHLYVTFFKLQLVFCITEFVGMRFKQSSVIYESDLN